MEPEKKDIGKIVADATNDTVEGVKDASVKVAGKVSDIGKDIAIGTGKVYDYLKEKANDAKERAHIEKVKQDKKILKPVWIDDIKSEEFDLPNMIRVTDYDEKRMGNEACVGSIGYIDVVRVNKTKNTVRVFNVYTPYAKQIGVSFYPNIVESLYYVTPFENNKYAEINGYFSYEETLKHAELNEIACSLGAKVFQVNTLEEKRILTKKKTDAKGNANVNAQVNGKYSDDTESSNWEVKKLGSRIELSGSNNPKQPKLKYFAHDPNILALVNMRLNSDNRIKKHDYILDYNASCMLRENQAVQVDAVIDKYGLSGNGTVTSLVEEERRMKFEYHLEFPEDDK